MELISWSLNAIDKIFSTRNTGPGEAACPQGTYNAGYALDSWDEWKLICMSILSVEDIEDLYIIGLLVTQMILIGVGFAVIWRKIERAGALKGGKKLPVMVNELGGNVCNQSLAINELCRKLDHTLEKISALIGEIRNLRCVPGAPQRP